MSLYNQIYGVNPATFFILPMLGRHPEEYPRYRDCFAGKFSRSEDEKDPFGIPLRKVNNSIDIISVYLRVGGGNRIEYQEEIEELRSHPEYINDFDDTFDNTFAIFEFSVPEEWKADYQLIKEGKVKELSDEYKTGVKIIYPKLEDKLDEIFKVG